MRWQLALATARFEDRHTVNNKLVHGKGRVAACSERGTVAELARLEEGYSCAKLEQLLLACG